MLCVHALGTFRPCLFLLHTCCIMEEVAVHLKFEDLTYQSHVSQFLNLVGINKRSNDTFLQIVEWEKEKKKIHFSQDAHRWT